MENACSSLRTDNDDSDKLTATSKNIKSNLINIDNLNRRDSFHIFNFARLVFTWN